MERQKFENFLAYESADNSKKKLTRFNFNNTKDSLVGHFFEANQTKELREQNQWILVVGNSCVNIKGETVDNIKQE